MAATLAVPGSLASHQSAARLLGLPIETKALDLTVLRAQRGLEDVTLHRTRTLDKADRSWHGEIPSTSVTRTLIDLAGVVPHETLESALDKALARRLVPLPYLVERFQALGGRGRRGGRVLGQLLAERSNQVRFSDSNAQRLLMDVVKRRGIKGVIPEYKLILADGRVIYVDAACPPVRFGVELDGFLWHSQMSDWAGDHERNNAAIAAGWSLLHVTPYTLKHDPDGVADLIERALDERGGIAPGPGPPMRRSCDP